MYNTTLIKPTTLPELPSIHRSLGRNPLRHSTSARMLRTTLALSGMHLTKVAPSSRPRRLRADLRVLFLQLKCVVPLVYGAERISTSTVRALRIRVLHEPFLIFVTLPMHALRITTNTVDQAFPSPIFRVYNKFTFLQLSYFSSTNTSLTLWLYAISQHGCS